MDEQLKVRRLRRDATLPSKSYDGDAGLDLYTVGEYVLAPGAGMDVPTGIAVEFPHGVWGRITGRSSTFRRRRLLVLEGIIDNGFRGELFAYVTNMGSEPATIRPGERLAQLVLSPLINPPTFEVAVLSESDRGQAGFGSTGGNGDGTTIDSLDAAMGRAGYSRTTEIPPVRSGDTHDAEGYPVGPIEAAARLAWETSPPSHSLTRRASMSEDAHAPAARASWEEPPVPEVRGPGLTLYPAIKHPYVYLGGPIDAAGDDVDARHRAWTAAAEAVGAYKAWCPYCQQLADPQKPVALILRNMTALDMAEWAVFAWTGRPTVGVPIEIWRKAEQTPDRVIVVGALPVGAFALYWQQMGVRFVDSLDAAARLIAESIGEVE